MCVCVCVLEFGFLGLFGFFVFRRAFSFVGFVVRFGVLVWEDASVATHKTGTFLANPLRK